MEEAASGPPSAAYRVPDISKTVVEIVTGLLVSDGNVAVMSSAIRGTTVHKKHDYANGCKQHAEQHILDSRTRM